jgi:nucleotide-binding universal stress UspA family protein
MGEEQVDLKRVLVPLDGSRLAECVLPTAMSLGAHLHARVTLLHVMERAAPHSIHGDRHLTAVQEADQYLAKVAARAEAQSVVVERHVHPNQEGDVAKSIVDHAADLGADMIVLAAHGASGARRVLFGSVAQQVLRRGVRPVLIIRPPEGQASEDAAPTDFRRLLVPLDGQPPAESVLPVASALARAYTAELILLCVVPTLATLTGERASTARLTPTATAASLDLEEAEGQVYIQGVARALRGRGLRVSASVGRGEPAQSLLEGAVKSRVEMIAMATHGRAGLDAVFSGSVASRIVARFTRPILLVRAGESRDVGPVPPGLAR